MKIFIFVLLIVLGISSAVSSKQYKNPYPYTDNVWGPAFPDNIQEKAKSMEWEHNKRLRNLTEHLDKLAQDYDYSKMYNFTAAHILAPYERNNLSGMKIEYKGVAFEFGPINTDGFKYLGPPYMTADYKNLKANLTLSTMQEIHLKGEFTYTVSGGSPKPVQADIYTEQGGTTFTAMISMLKKVNGHYEEDVTNNVPRCFFEFENLKHTYDTIDDPKVVEAMEADNHYVERQLFQMVADSFCVPYMTHIKEKIDYIYEWNSPVYQMRSALGQGMFDIMKQYEENEASELKDFDIGQGYTIKQCCGYDVEFVEGKVHMDGTAVHLLDPMTYYSNNKAGVDIMFVMVRNMSVDFKMMMKNETHSFPVQQTVEIITPMRFLLNFVKNVQNKYESIHLASHPDIVIGGTYDVKVDESVDANVQKVLKSLNPYYHDAFTASSIGYAQYRLFKFFYPGYMTD